MNEPSKRVAFFTLGCKLNQFETYDLERQFTDRGYSIRPFSAEADIYVVNTCTVTGKTDYRCRQALRKARRRNPAARVIAVGCYTQTRPGEVAGMPEVDLVLGNSEKGDIFSHLDGEGEIKVGSVSARQPAAFPEITRFGNHTRAFVKVQDGCDSRCSYCIVPLARGPNRSHPADQVINQVSRLAREGYREVVLTGVHLGTWGRDLSSKETLSSLLSRLTDLPGLDRLRLSSIEPTEFTDDLLDTLVSQPKICRHLHIPLQSGSARILKAMRRPYTPERYLDLARRLASLLPDLGLGADVIAGFPGEDEAGFEETVRLLEELPLSYLHVFPYSRRPGTSAADFPDQVHGEEKDRRSRQLRNLGREKADAFRRERLGDLYTVLVEGQSGNGNGERLGLTGNYLKVHSDFTPDSVNTFRTVKLTSYEEGKLYGKIEP